MANTFCTGQTVGGRVVTLAHIATPPIRQVIVHELSSGAVPIYDGNAPSPKSLPDGSAEVTGTDYAGPYKLQISPLGVVSYEAQGATVQDQYVPGTILMIAGTRHEVAQKLNP